MSFLSLLFYTYLIVVPLAVIGFGLWLLRYMTRMEYAPEKRTLFTVIVIACLTFIAFSLGLKLHKARSGDTPAPPAEQQPTPESPEPVIIGAVKETAVPQQPATGNTADYPTGEQQLVPENLSEEDRLRLFETENFPALYEQRMALGQEIKATEAFFRRINALANQTPKHYSLLRDIAQIRKNGYEKLKQRNISASQYLRDFWVHYNTGNSHDAIRKFTPIAEQLTKKIKETRGQLLDNKRREEKVISAHMYKVGASLKTNTIPGSQAGKITSYNTQNRRLIIDWLRAKGAIDMLDALDNLAQQRNIINDRVKRIQSFQKRYPDLNQTLSRTLELWAQAEESNYYAEYRLLYAAESRYIVEHLDLATDTADKRLDKELRTYTSAVTQHADVALGRAEQAYQPEEIR